MRITLILFSCIIVFAACKKENTVRNQDHVETFSEAEIKYFKAYEKNILGEWRIDSMHIKLGLIKIPNTKDTIVYNYGKIIVTALEPDQINPDKLNNLKGYIVSQKDTTPIKSMLLGIPGKPKISSITNISGAVESTLYFEKPVPTNQLSQSYQFLSHYMLGDNFVMSLDTTKTQLTWKGYRYIEQINFTKIK